MSNSANILLEINSPEATILNQMVERVSLPGVCGRFEVLKNHAPLITALEEGTLKYVVDGKETTMNIKSGFVDVLKNKVSVCLDL